MSTYLLIVSTLAEVEYISGNGSSIGLAQKYGCSNDRVLEWVARYQIQGEAAFEEVYKKQSYSPDFKKMVLEEYLSGGISLRSLALKHKILDNAPMEGFWGTLKCEMYYLDNFHTYEQLEKAVEEYIYFYNNKGYQAKYKGLAPLQARNQAFAA